MSAFAVFLPVAARSPTFQICPFGSHRLQKPSVSPRMVLSEKESKSGKSRSKKPLAKKPAVPQPNYPVSDASTSAETMSLRLTGNNVPLTDSLRKYVTDKLGKVTARYQSLLTKMDVHLTVEHNPSIANGNKAEVVAFAGKIILRNEVRADDMYAAIDLVQERISRTIRKYKERRDGKTKHSKSKVIPVDVDLDEMRDNQGYDDGTYSDIKSEMLPGVPAVNEIVRRKVFPMPMQTVEEAVLCCEYVDHPWYLFRNAETNQICLVYKRNRGGYGLIEPSNPDSKDEEQVL